MTELRETAKRVFSPQHRANIAAARQGRKFGPRSAECRARQSVALKRIQKEIQNRPSVRILKSLSRRGNMPPNYDQMLVATDATETPRLKWVRKLWQFYGLTIEAFAWLWYEQDGRCALCEKRLPHFGKGQFAVDHNHSTGRVRGILCAVCNHRVLPTVELVGVARIADYLNRGTQ